MLNVYARGYTTYGAKNAKRGPFSFTPDTTRMYTITNDISQTFLHPMLIYLFLFVSLFISVHYFDVF